jgi:hypothetical protein
MSLSDLLDTIRALLFEQARVERIRKTLTQETGNPMLGIAIHQSRALDARQGRAPERMLSQYIAQALESAGFDYEIDIGFERLFEPPHQDNSLETYQWWTDVCPKIGFTCNMLLYDARGGGRAAIDDQYAIVGMNRVRSLDEEITSPCNTQQCHNIWAGIHELGHSLGGRHDTPMMQEKPAMLFHTNMVSLLRSRAESAEIGRQ